MKTFQPLNFRKALIAFFSIVGMLLASPANSKVIGSSLQVPGVAKVSQTALASAAQQSLGAFESVEGAVLDTNRVHAVSLPLAILAPNSKWSALFPAIGLVAAVAVTQVLRRRRIAQLRADSAIGQ